MNRREFFSSLGFGMAAAILDIKQMLPAEAPVTIAGPEGYLIPHFTGFKAAHAQTVLSGQFLWGVLFEDLQGRIDVTHYYTNCSLDEAMLSQTHSAEQRSDYITSRITNALLTVSSLMDQAVTESHSGQVTVIRQRRNLDYDPLHAATHEDKDDSFCSKCWPTYSVHELIPCRRIKVVDYTDIGRRSDPDIWSVQYQSPKETLFNLALASAMGKWK